MRLVVDQAEKPSLALDLDPATTFDEWVAIGRRLCVGRQALNWHIGDWWAFGDHRYGELAAKAAAGIFGKEYQTLANLASVSRAVETSRRRESLTWTHHAETVVLEPDDADDLLERAEREHLSTRDLRREVKALKTANDPEPVIVEPAPVSPKPAHPQSVVRELNKAYEAVIEFADALRQHRRLTRRENDLLSTALAFFNRVHTDHRECPDDFDVIFVEKGRLECEVWYRASRITINRWLMERGKRGLIEQRMAFVRRQRELDHPAPEPRPCGGNFFSDASPVVAGMAANFLCISRNGGWIISQTGEGDWWVGTRRRPASELIAIAERKGFNVRQAQLEAEATSLQAEAEAGVDSSP